MSEGTFFHSAEPNITLYIGGLIIRFKNGRFPGRNGVFATPEEIEAIKTHPLYGKTIETDEDRQERLTPDPKEVEDLQARALEVLKTIPGVVPSDLTPLSPPSEEPEKSQEQDPEPLVPLPSLTEVSRMKKDDLLDFCEPRDIEVTEADTVAILKRKVRSWLKQHA